MENLAIIDMGSNSIRFIVMQINDNHSYFLQYQQKEAIRLGKGMSETGKLNPDGVKRALECLHVYKHMMEVMQVTRCIAVATAARTAVERVQRECWSALRRGTARFSGNDARSMPSTPPLSENRMAPTGRARTSVAKTEKSARAGRGDIGTSLVLSVWYKNLLERLLCQVADTSEGESARGRPRGRRCRVVLPVPLRPEARCATIRAILRWRT